jgi:glutaredoxin
MYVLIGKQKCNRCDILKNLLDEKGIQYHYVDVNNMPHNTFSYNDLFENVLSLLPCGVRCKIF